MFEIFKKKTKNFVASQNEISRIKIPQYLINDVGILWKI